jgi:CheY-like chemotaxis protein
MHRRSRYSATAGSSCSASIYILDLSRIEAGGIPMIALTAAASERDRQEGMQAGFIVYLTKPAQVDELIDALETPIQ